MEAREKVVLKPTDPKPVLQPLIAEPLWFKEVIGAGLAMEVFDSAYVLRMSASPMIIMNGDDECTGFRESPHRRAEMLHTCVEVKWNTAFNMSPGSAGELLDGAFKSGDASADQIVAAVTVEDLARHLNHQKLWASLSHHWYLRASDTDKAFMVACLNFARTIRSKPVGNADGKPLAARVQCLPILKRMGSDHLMSDRVPATTRAAILTLVFKGPFTLDDLLDKWAPEEMVEQAELTTLFHLLAAMAAAFGWAAVRVMPIDEDPTSELVPGGASTGFHGNEEEEPLLEFNTDQIVPTVAPPADAKKPDTVNADITKATRGLFADAGSGPPLPPEPPPRPLNESSAPKQMPQPPPARATGKQPIIGWKEDKKEEKKT